MVENRCFLTERMKSGHANGKCIIFYNIATVIIFWKDSQVVAEPITSIGWAEIGFRRKMCCEACFLCGENHVKIPLICCESGFRGTGTCLYLRKMESCFTLYRFLFILVPLKINSNKTLSKDFHKICKSAALVCIVVIFAAAICTDSLFTATNLSRQEVYLAS